MSRTRGVVGCCVAVVGIGSIYWFILDLGVTKTLLGDQTGGANGTIINFEPDKSAIQKNIPQQKLGMGRPKPKTYRSPDQSAPTNIDINIGENRDVVWLQINFDDVTSAVDIGQNMNPESHNIHDNYEEPIDIGATLNPYTTNGTVGANSVELVNIGPDMNVSRDTRTHNRGSLKSVNIGPDLDVPEAY